MSNTTSPPEQFSFRQWAHPFLLKKYWFITGIVLTLAVAGLYLWITPPSYLIKTSIVIQDEKKGESLGSNFRELEFMNIQKIVDNESEVLKSENILRKVCEELGLNQVWQMKTAPLRRMPLEKAPVKFTIEGNISKTEQLVFSVSSDAKTILLHKKPIAAGTPVKMDGYTLIAAQTDTTVLNTLKGQTLYCTIGPVSNASNELRKRLNISSPTKTSSVLHITCTHPSPETGTAILSAIVKRYNNIIREEKKKQTDTLLSMIGERLIAMSDQLENYERKTSSFKSGNQVTGIPEDIQALLNKTRENDNRKRELSLQLEQLRYLKNRVATGEVQQVATPSGLSAPSLQKLLETYTRLKLENETLQRTTGAAHPSVKAMNAQLKDVLDDITQHIQTQTATLEIAVEGINNESAEIEKRISTIPDKERNLLAMLREKDIRENIYTFLLQKREEAGLLHSDAFGPMRVIDPPFASAEPVKPNKTLLLAGALFAGLIMPFFAIAISEAFRKKIHHPSQFPDQQKLLYPHLVPIPRNISRGSFGQLSPEMKTVLRAIRDKICRRHTNGDQPLSIVLSTTGREKHTVAFATLLAGSFAALGKSVALANFSDQPPFPEELPLVSSISEQPVFAVQQETATAWHLLPVYNDPETDAEAAFIQRHTALFHALRHQYNIQLFVLPPLQRSMLLNTIEPFLTSVIFLLEAGRVKEETAVRLQESLQEPEKSFFLVVRGQQPIKRMFGIK